MILTGPWKKAMAAAGRLLEAGYDCKCEGEGGPSAPDTEVTITIRHMSERTEI